MAQLKFDGIQPVMFGGRDCMPKLDAELRLRVQNLNFNTEAETQKSDEILAKCFPDDEDYVLEFMHNQMTPYEKQELRAYLISGPAGIRMINDAMQNAIREETKNA